MFARSVRNYCKCSALKSRIPQSRIFTGRPVQQPQQQQQQQQQPPSYGKIYNSNKTTTTTSPNGINNFVPLIIKRFVGNSGGCKQMANAGLVLLLPVAGFSWAVAAHEEAPKSRTYSTSRQIESSDDNSNMSGSDEYKNAKSIYDFTVKDTHGNDVSLEKYKGHVVLIVNIASKCGLTKNNYKKLTDLKEKYGEKGLKILNFPCNQFGSQMPEEDGEPMVCHLRDAKADIGDVFQKVNVNGDDAAPLYQYLKAQQKGTLGSGIKWNFTKFLVNKEGIPVNRYAPTTDPMDIGKDIEKLL